jgi:S-formylglutathione hydrolase FrmB
VKNALIVSAGQIPIIGASADEWVAPGQALIVPVRLFTTPKSEGVGDGGSSGVWAYDAPGDGACLNVGVRVGDSKGVVQPLQIGLRCRTMAQSFVITYIDHDSSVASAAAVRPWEECPEPVGCPVLLSLSGVGVNEMNQADSHKHIPKGEQHATPQNRCSHENAQTDISSAAAGGGKEFVFGYKAAWVLAPQRDGAHNWEGTGHQTAVQSIRALDVLANSRANQAERWGVFSGRKADTTRILFAGHSRGGHGAWMMGMHYPDLAVGVASLSGYDISSSIESVRL